MKALNSILFETKQVNPNFFNLHIEDIFFGDNSEEICPFNTFFDHHRDNVPLVVTFNSVNFKQIIWTKYYIEICKETDFVKLKRGKTTVVKIALNE